MPDPIPPSDATPDGAATPRPSTQGIQIGGFLLLLNAALVVIETFLLPSAKGPTVGLGPAVFDVLIGASLVQGNTKYQPWAIVRAVAGAVIWTALSLSNGERLVAALQVLVSASLLGLLIGQAGRARIVASCLAFGLYGVFELLGIVALTTGVNPLASMTMQLSGDLEPEAAGPVRGVAFDYTVTAPASTWHLYKAEVMRQNNPMADRWLVRPDLDAHVLVIAEQLEPGMTLPLKNLSKVVLENARKAAPDLVVIEDGPMANRDGWLLRYRGTTGGIGMEFYVGLYAHGRYVVQAQGFAAQKGFPAAMPEIERAVGSLELPRD